MNRPEFKVKNKIATITLRAEARKNAVDRKDLDLIAKFLEKIKNEKLRCLILSGKGDTFSSGMYLQELNIGDWQENPISEVCDLIEKLPFISICLLNGGIYGGSVELALSCDFRIGCSSVKLKIPATKFGIHYGVKGIRRCLEAFGLQLSRKILFLGQSLDFKELIDVGFLDYHAKDIDSSNIILKRIIDEISELSLDAIWQMKATLHDLRNNNINHSREKSRFSHSFKSGIVAKRLKFYRKSKKEE